MAAENYRAPSVAQSAELAEQQGVDAVDDQLLDELRDVEDYFNDVDPNPIHLATVQAAISALAARQPGRRSRWKSPEFTDTARAAIAWVLWHHQGGSSPVGQPLRFSLGMGQHDRMTDHQIAEAKRFAEWAGATTEGFHRHKVAQGIDLGQQQDAARWRAIAPLLSVEWDEDEQLKRWTWIDFKGDAPAIPSPTRQEYASVDEAVDALIDQRDAAPGVGNG